jgi:hypothetical protein
METPGNNYLESTKKLFAYYRSLGDSVIARLDAEQLQWQYNEASNSVAVIIKHIAGNSLSRWTDFLTADGEKQWRNRDDEFENESFTKQKLTDLWNKGWDCLFNAIEPLTDADLLRIIYIRNEGHTVTGAINRQLAHLPYHIGQMVFIAKLILGDKWESLTILKGQSTTFNADKFAGGKKKQFFTDSTEKK